MAAYVQLLVRGSTRCPALTRVLRLPSRHMWPACRSMLDGPNRPEARTMLIELILSIPARLSDLLVVLTSLMRPLVMALQEGQELVGLGLRTLEYWVDRYISSYPYLYVIQYRDY